MIPEWEEWVNEAISKLRSSKLLRSLRPIQLSSANCNAFQSSLSPTGDDLIFDGPRKWDRDSVQVNVLESTFQKWLHDTPSSGDDDVTSFLNMEADSSDGKLRKLTNFSGSDYMALSSHPAVCRAAIEATQEHGMGPRGSALICGYTSYHRLLESSLAELKRKEECILCPTGFSANMAVMTAVGSIISLLSDQKPAESEKVAVFSDSLNHASIIDGIRLAAKQGNVVTFVYRHCDMNHLNELLSRCSMKKKMVITDSLFSMDGDFAPLHKLVELRKKHQFLFVLDDAHATFVCGKNGGGAAEMFDCESDIDLCIGTLSKAAGCIGGFIACSKNWKLLIQSRGRSFIFSTSTSVPMVAAAAAAVMVSKKESWRRDRIREHINGFRAMTRIRVESHIISIVVGSEETALSASRRLLRSGFHVTAIRPPTVPPNSCRLRITLTAGHSKDDLRELADELLAKRDAILSCKL